MGKKKDVKEDQKKNLAEKQVDLKKDHLVKNLVKNPVKKNLPRRQVELKDVLLVKTELTLGI